MLVILHMDFYSMANYRAKEFLKACFYYALTPEFIGHLYELLYLIKTATEETI